MNFSDLALIAALGLLGPVLATPSRWRLPVVLGELIGGIALGTTGTRTLHAANPTFTFLADIGFALVMFVAGSHVPVRDPTLRRSLPKGLARAVGVGAVSVPVALGISHAFGTGHTPLYAVLLASSSAALVLPIIDGVGLRGPQVLQLLPQVAVADAACIVALPLAIDPAHAGRAALGALAVIAAAAALFVMLWFAERRGYRKRLRELSEHRQFALELRINLLILFALAAIATQTHVSIMLAGFSFGLVVAAFGEPRRLASQLFAITEGFLGPLYFVWLGASLDLRAVGTHPRYLLLGIVLGAAAVAVHAAVRLTGLQLPYAVLAAAQMGVPVSAATLGTQLGLLKPGEPASLILGALITIGAGAAAGTRAARGSRAVKPSGASGSPPR